MEDIKAGIEALNLYGGSALMDVETIFVNRGLELDRFSNLMMVKKAVSMPCEDPVTNGVNAAKPIIDRLTEDEKKSIEVVITATESGIDFGKSISTYIHDYLGLNKNCRLFELKQACYGGTAALQMACSYVVAHKDFNPKVLVIATDVCQYADKVTYAEPSQGTGAVAFLIGLNPSVFEIDFGAMGMYSFEVMDTCRPKVGEETGDPDLSLFSYMDCLENSYKAYADRVEDIEFCSSFSHLAFHTPFAGMVKGAHRQMMRKFSNFDKQQIQADFEKRVEPSLKYSMQVGNLYSASLYMALASLIDNSDIEIKERIGLFSYGSGCSSEFFSGLIGAESKKALANMNIQQKLSNRYELNMQEYEQLLILNNEWGFGIRDKVMDLSLYSSIYTKSFEGKNLLYLSKISDYHREYQWS